MNLASFVMSAKRWHRVLLCLIVFTLISYVAFEILIGERQRALTEREKKLDEALRMRDTAQEKFLGLDDFPPLPEQLQESLGKLAGWRNRLPLASEPSAAAVLSDIAKIANVQQIAIENVGEPRQVTLYYGEGRHNYNRVPMLKREASISFTANYRDLVGFLKRIENEGLYMEIPQISVKPKKLEPTQLEVSMRLYLYSLDAEPPEKTDDAG